MATIASNELPLSAPSVWAYFMEYAQGIAKGLVRKRRLSEPEQLFYEAAERYAGTILDAQDVAELRNRLYEVSRQPSFIGWEAELLRTLELPKDASDPATPPEEGFIRVFGDSRLVRECARLMSARAEVIAQILSNLKVEDLSQDVPQAVFGLLNDFRTPPTLRSLAEETLAGEAALLGLIAASMDPTRWQLSPWVRLALLEQLLLASRSHLRLLSVVPNVTIPEDVLPPEERLSGAILDEEMRERSKFTLPGRLRVQPQFGSDLLAMLDADE